MSTSRGPRTGPITSVRRRGATRSRLAAAILSALAVAAAALAGAVPAGAASGPDITVQIEGETATIVEQRPVSLDYNKFSPPAPWPGSSAPANSIAAAIETALNDAYGTPPAGGWWDRQSFVSTIKDETLIWPMSWSFWTNRAYGNKGAMDGGDQWGLDYGDDLLISGGGSIGEWPEPTRPERLPVDLSGAGVEGPAAVPAGAPFPVEVTAWMPQEGDTDMPPGPSERQRASHPIAGEGYTVVAMPDGTTYDRETVGAVALDSGRTDDAGRATVTVSEPGRILVKAVREDAGAPFGGSPLGAQGRSPARPVCVFEPNSGDCGTPVLAPAAGIDAGEAPVGGIGAAAPLTVTASGPSTITGARVLGPDAADFVLSAGECVDEPAVAGGSCKIAVRLAPTATGSRSATLRIKSSAESLPRDVALTGTGTAAPGPAVDPPALAVRVTPKQRRVRRGKAVKLTATVRNTGAGRADDVLVCVRAPAGFTVGRSCGKRPSVAAGEATRLSFRVRANRRAPLRRFRKATVRATANGVGFTGATARVAARR